MTMGEGKSSVQSTFLSCVARMNHPLSVARSLGFKYLILRLNIQSYVHLKVGSVPTTGQVQPPPQPAPPPPVRTPIILGEPARVHACELVCICHR